VGTHYRGRPAEIRALDVHIKMMRATNAVRARLDGHLRTLDLTEKQLGVLEALLHLGPLQQHELGDKLLVSRANVTLIVDQLSRRGWVRRERRRDDRRCILVHLTAAGRRAIETIFPDHLAEIVGVFSGLTAPEQRELARLCRKLGLSLSGA
jgi:MarR family 2-MHQ and catechol resistance regulon transcriptional repressor